MVNEKKSFLERYVKVIVVLAVVAGSSSGIFGSVIQAPSMAIGFWRLTLGLPFFAVPVLLHSRDTLKQISRKDLAWTFVAGAFLFCHFFTWFNAVKMTNIASAVVLAALHPLVVLLVTIFVFKRHVGARPIMGIVLALLGGTVVAGLDKSQLSSGNFTGDMLAFAAAVFMGLYFLVGNEVRKNVPGPTYVFLCFLACWICFTVGILATKTPVLGYSTKDYILLVGLTLVCQIGAHAVFNLCFGYVDSLYVSAWESGESVFAIAMGFIFLHQTPASWELIGAAVVVLGLLYYNYTTGIEGRKAAAENAAIKAAKRNK
jgi:Permeases of the drug/metabolite transporter (DMT) superfamily